MVLLTCVVVVVLLVAFVTVAEGVVVALTCVGPEVDVKLESEPEIAVEAAIELLAEVAFKEELFKGAAAVMESLTEEVVAVISVTSAVPPAKKRSVIELPVKAETE
jgi:hypothetical protein